jgi:drug/metabolite transporter (DMT)-like permease
MNPTLVAAITLAHEKRRPYIKESVAILLSILGCYFVLDISASFKFDIIGILSGLGAAIWYAFYIKISEKVLHKIEPIQATTYISLGAGLTFLLIAAFNNEITLPTSTQAWTAIIGISVLSTVIPITLFFKGINILGAHRASIISTLEPVFTSMLGALLLQETFSTIQFIGAVAIIAAVVVIQYPTRPHRNQTAQKNHLQEGIL